MLFVDDCELRFATLTDFDRRAFLLGGASSAAMLHGANAQLLMLGVGSGDQGAGSPPPVALAGALSTPSLNFTSANEGMNSSQQGVIFPGASVNTPGTVGLPWYMMFSFHVPNSIQGNAAGLIGHKSATLPNSGSGTFFTITALTLALACNVGYAGGTLIPAQTLTLQRGVSYTVIFGSTGSFAYHMTLIDAAGNVIANAAFTGTTNFAANYGVISGLGAPVGLTTAAQLGSYGFGGSVANACMAWGAIPLTAGASTTTTAPVSTSGGNVIPVASMPGSIAAGQILWDSTTGKAVGTVASWAGLNITITQANPVAAIGNGDTLVIGQVPLLTGGATYGTGTLDLTSIATGKLSPKDFVLGNAHTLRYFCPLAGPGAPTLNAYAAVTTGSALRFGTSVTATEANGLTDNVATATSSTWTQAGAILNVSAIPSALGARQNIYNATSGSQVGSVQAWYPSATGTFSSIAGSVLTLSTTLPTPIAIGGDLYDGTNRVGTITAFNNGSKTVTVASVLFTPTAGDTLTFKPAVLIFEPNVLSAVTIGDTLVFGGVPTSIRVGQYVFNATSRLRVGTTASWDSTRNAVTISQANPLNPIAANDQIIIGGQTTASAAVSTGTSIPVAFVPGNIARGQNLYNLTASNAVGTVTDWDTVANTITIAQANPANAVASGDTISVSGLNADPAGAIVLPMTYPTAWTQACLPLAGDPIIKAPWLSLRPSGTSAGEYYVWGGTPGATTAPVWFEGHYATSGGGTPTFEGKLTRRDSGATFVNWTALSGLTTTPGSGSTVSFAGGYLTPAQGTSNTNVSAGASAILSPNVIPPGLRFGNTVYNVTTGQLLGTVKTWASTVTLNANTLAAVNINDVLVFGGIATLIFATALPCGLPVNSTVTVAGLSTAPVNGVSVAAINGAQTVLNSTPNSVTIAYSGMVQAKTPLQSIGSGTLTWSGFGLYSGYLPAVAAGVGFTRSLRYAGQTATAVHGQEKHGVGAVVYWHAQSNGAVMFSVIGGNGSLVTAGGSTSIAPIDGDNSFCVALQPNTGGVTDPTTNTSNGDFWAAEALHAGRYGNYSGLNLNTALWGDGITVAANKFQTQSSLPVMFINAHLSGHGMPAWSYDRQSLTSQSPHWSSTGVVTTVNTGTKVLTFSAALPAGLAVGRDVYDGTNLVGPITAINTGTKQVTIGGGFLFTPTVNDTLTFAGLLDGWDPNGSTTVFNIQLQPNLANSLPEFGKPSPYGGTYPTSGPITYSNTAPNNPFPIVPGTLTGTIAGIPIADDGNGNLSGSFGGVTVSATINYRGSPTAFPNLQNLTFSAAPAVGALYTLTWTTALALNAADTNSTHLTPDFYGTAGVARSGGINTDAYSALALPHTGVLGSAYAALGKNTVTAYAHVWWSPLVNSAAGGNPVWTYGSYPQGLEYMESMKWLHKLWPNGQNAKRFWGLVARVDNGPVSGPYLAGAGFGSANFQMYQYAANQIANGVTDLGLLPEAYDSSCSSATPNAGPHQDFAGGMICGERYGLALAAGLGYGGANFYSGTSGQVSTTWNGGTGNPAQGAPVMGPVLKTVTRVTSGGNVTGLVLTYDLPNGTALTTQNGLGTIGSAVKGFLIGTDPTSDGTAFTNRVVDGATSGSGVVFAATITATNQVTIAFSGTAFATSYHISLNYCADMSVFSASGFAGYVSDNGASGIGALLCDNAGGFSYPTPQMVAAWSCPGAPAGNLAASVLSWAA